MREVTYKDAEGRYWVHAVPDSAPDSDAGMGILVGPPPLDELALPPDTELRLHNELFSRRLLTYQDVRRRRQDVFAALQAAFQVDTDRVVSLYIQGG